jgi:hypothetical protein
LHLEKLDLFHSVHDSVRLSNGCREPMIAVHKIHKAGRELIALASSVNGWCLPGGGVYLAVCFMDNRICIRVDYVAVEERA